MEEAEGRQGEDVPRGAWWGTCPVVVCVLSEGSGLCVASEEVMRGRRKGKCPRLPACHLPTHHRSCLGSDVRRRLGEMGETLLPCLPYLPPAPCLPLCGETVSDVCGEPDQW